MIYSMKDFIMANFCLYAYEGPDSLAKAIFRDGLMFGGNAWKFNRSNFIENTITDTQCYIITSSSSNDIVLVFRGTESLTDWKIDLSNVTYADSTWPADQPGSKVGSGWLQAWNSVKPEVEQCLRAVLPSQDARVFIAGHSLGAALAAVATVDIWRDVLSKAVSKISVELVTFASPLVGNGTFAAYFEKLKGQFGEYRLYRDPEDKINMANEWMAWSKLWNDPYVDFKNIFSTSKGAGHAISNYVNLLNPGTVEYTVKGGTNWPSRALAPDDAVSTLTIAVATSENFKVDEYSPPPPINFSLIAGVNEDGSGGVELPLYKDGSGTPYFKPKGIVFQTFDSAAHGLKVSDLKRCRLTLSMTCTVDEQCNINMTNPILLDGFQFIVNGFPIMTDFAMGATVSLNNTSFKIDVPTPHYNIVGGRMQITDSTSKKPWLEALFWGARSDKEVYISNGYCFTEHYGDLSSYYTSVYLVPTGEKTSNVQRVVGGRMQITDVTSKKPWIEELFWGERSASEVNFWNNFSYSTIYERGYSYTSLYLSPAGAAPTNQAKVIGGRFQVTDATSKMPWIETSFWGERSDNEVYVSNAFCYSAQYGDNSYCYTTIYTDRPVTTSGMKVTTLEVSLLSIYCEHPQEFGMFGNHDEIYIKANGSKVWPQNSSYYSITMGQSAQINQTFEVSTVMPARWELWETDDLSGDDQLYEFFFSNDLLAYDPDSDQYTALQDCSPGKTYRIFGRKVDGENYGYYLNVQVQKKG